MRGVRSYYQQIEVILEKWDKDAALEFKKYTETHTPNYVYLWLMEKQKSDQFPKEIESVMKDLFWEIQ
jgi:hypothetical protein